MITKMEETSPPLPKPQRDLAAPSSVHDKDAFSNITVPSRTSSPELGPTKERLLPRQPDGKDMSSRSPFGVPKSSRRAHLFRNWWIELGACLIFVLALLAIIVTLHPHQNKPLPQWPYSISINSLVSIYVVILKAAIMLVTAEGLGTFLMSPFIFHRL